MSHNAPLWNRNGHISFTKWCIGGFGQHVYDAMAMAIIYSGCAHQSWDALNMMASSNENIFCVTGHLPWNLLVTGEIPTQRPVTWSFGVFFDLRLNKRLSKQPRGWWFETQSWSLWRHCNGPTHCSSRPSSLTFLNLQKKFEARVLSRSLSSVKLTRYDSGLSTQFRLTRNNTATAATSWRSSVASM